MFSSFNSFVSLFIGSFVILKYSGNVYYISITDISKKSPVI